MITGRARRRGTIARIAVAGALALVVLLAGAGLESVAATAAPSEVHRAVIAARETKANLVAATTTRSRGNAWFASLLGAVSCAVLGAYLLRAVRRRDFRSDLRQLSFRLRAPPRPLVAH